MLVYWTMFAVPALSTIIVGARKSLYKHRSRIGLGMGFLMFVFMILIGLRHEVGTDWFNYQRTVNQIRFFGFAGALGYKDPGFGLSTWLSVKLGWGVYGANFVCGAILMYGLARFAKRQPDAWLAITAAVPYLIIVVGMGYVRQAAAIGFILLAINQFEDRRFYRFLGWMAAAASFHGPSLCILPIAGMVVLRERKSLLIPVGLLSIILYVVLLRDRVDDLLYGYVEKDYDSAGALVRLAMNAVAAGLFLMFRKRFNLDDQARSLWTVFSLVALAMMAALYFIESTTAVDRLGLYFIPIQLFVFGNIAPVLAPSRAGVTLISMLVVFYYGSTLYVWLTYADNAVNWLPYQFVPGIF